MKRESLYHRVVSVCTVLGVFSAWGLFFVPSVLASPVVKPELQEQEMESVQEPVDGFEQNDSLFTLDENPFDSQSQDESFMDPATWEDESDVDENVLDEEILDEIEGLDSPPEENLDPPPPAE